MKHIFLDFDRTLFDTEAFYNSLELTHIEGIIAGQLGADFSRFLYSDAISFMCNAKVAGYNCHLVTFGRRSVQECKVKLSGLEPYFAELFYMEQGSKAEVIHKYLNSGVSCEKVVFIDDSIEHLAQVHELLPQVISIRMARPGAKGSEVVNNRFLRVLDLEEAFDSLKS
jgi:FMN phosphatase YigB (HAD superfamily)